MVDSSTASLYAALAVLAATILLATRVRHGPLRIGGPDALKRPAASDPLSHALSGAEGGDFRAALRLMAAELRRRATFLPLGSESQQQDFEVLAQRLHRRASGAHHVEPAEAKDWVVKFQGVLGEPERTSE